MAPKNQKDKTIMDLFMHLLLRKLQALVEMKEQEENEMKQALLDKSVTKHKKVMMSLQVNLRKASLSASEKISSFERNELFSQQRKDSSENAAVQRRKRSQEKAASIASNVTSNLVRIAEMMNSQVEHNIESARVLEDSSKQLQETHEELKGMTGVIHMSKKLINKYSRRELTDTLLIFFGLVLFFSTVIYIILKRI